MMVKSKRPAFDKILSICADQRRSEDNIRPRCLCSLTVERALPFKFMETLLGKGRLVKAIVTVFSTLTVSLQFDNQVDVAVTDC